MAPLTDEGADRSNGGQVVDIFKSGPQPRLSGNGSKVGDERKLHTSVQDTPPPTRTVLPFVRRNYSYAPLKGEGDIFLPSEEDGDPGPSAA